MATLAKNTTPEFTNLNARIKAFSENGQIKTYANRKQAETKEAELTRAGYSVYVRPARPFLVILNETK